MKKIILATLLFCGLTSYAQNIELEGTWMLDSIELYKIVENDSIKMGNGDSIPNRFSGIFDTISFEGNNTIVNMEEMVKAPFRFENKLLSLYVSSIPMEYNFIEDDEYLVLFRKFRYLHDGESLTYSVILKYKK